MNLGQQSIVASGILPLLLAKLESGDDVLDYVTAQTDFNGYSTSYTRDAFGNAIARSSPDTGSWSFTLNEDNMLTGVTDARSVASALSYDAGDRLTGVSITGYSGEAETFSYDDTTSGNKGVGRLTSVADESGSTSRVFDNFGAITSETRVIGSQTYTISYSHDLANRITEIIYPSGRYVDFTFDSSGYLTTVTTKPSSGGSVTTLASSITHKPFGPITGLTYGNSEALTKTYDNNYWLSALNTVYSGTYVQELSYTQDNAGNLTAITDTLDSTRDESFGVDSLNRLHTASGKYGSRTYTYDSNSNRATRAIGGGATYTTTNVSGKNLPAHITDGTNTRHFTWTANGNMATDDRTFVGGGSAAFTFGGRNLLESMTVNSQGITYTINGLGQRVSEAFSGATTHYIDDINGNVIAEANGSTGATTMEYVWMEGELLAQIDGSGNIVYVHNSQVAAPQKITDPSRSLVWDQIREPFGEVSSTPTSTTPTNWRFPGQYANADNSLSHNGVRDYDPSCACYVESDPIGLAGGPNPIAYAGQNPTEAIDPLGMDLLVITGGWNGNFFPPNLAGHSAIAVTGAGVYSYGTGPEKTPLGGSTAQFLADQSATRNLNITIIHTTPAQDAAALQYLKAHPDERGGGLIDNCAARTKGALDAAGVDLQDPATLGLTSPPSLPGNVGASAAAVRGATTINILQGGAIPYSAISQFNPMSTPP